MRPHVIRRQQKPTRERPLYRYRESLVIAAVVVATPTHLAEIRVRTCSRSWIDNIHLRERQQVNTFASHIRECTHEVCRQLVLQGEAPLFDVGIFTLPVIVTR